MKFNPNEEAFFERRTEAHTPKLLESYNRSCYNWTPDMKDMILRASKSSINDYDWCPHQYKLKHIYRLSEPENDDMIRGTNVHSIVEYFWDNVDEPPHEPECICNNLNHNRYDETCPQNQKTDDSTPLEVASALLKEGKKMLAKDILWQVIPTPPLPYQFGEEVVIRKWFDWQWDRFLVCSTPDMDMTDWMPVGNEVSAHGVVMVEVDGEKYPVHLRGFIDTIFSDGEGGFILMELKTGKWREKKTATKMRVEMQIYRMMLEEGEYSDFLPITHWAWEFPRGYVNGGDRAEWELEETGTRKTQFAPRTAMRKIQNLVKGHLYDSFEPKIREWRTPNGETMTNCSYCSFMELCPAWGMNEGENEYENEEE